MSSTYYDILGLKATATQDEIKRAYRKKAMESHPDVNPSPGASDAFVQVNEAYAILSDANKRKVYNQKLRDQAARSAGQNYAQATQSAQSARDQAYQQWVQQARAQAKADASKNYQDFKNSKFERTEASVFLYLQFLIVGVFMILASLILMAPFAAMFFIDWKMVFTGSILVPVAFRMYEEGWKGMKAVKESI
ncbi:MAG: DnaJ domain-containing protein [Bacteroidetes bacterium]|jgi:curved DNA-binding protein CbpA|nr:DnaJ domain-containing protein [Bacteroidota bacterium]MBL0014847.1 DnaJ domain-containing protein [Bacteroidota bacterium]MBP6640257.1 DnaJ domain-containing protein [Bacteroidia bacterium]MBP8073755.1 DnaJ domain-containing protein [Bacteroidia bacterium]